MEILQNILIWLFGALSIIFLVIAFISIFSFGSSLFWVSEKANQKSHLYMLFAATSSLLWFIFSYPNLISVGIFCLLPMSILAVGLSYFKTQNSRKLFREFTEKTNIDYPFKDKQD
jgi:hypothetical protein